MWDICLAFYDWSVLATSRLRKILKETNSKIIVSSDWREEKFPYMVKDLLRIYNLSEYWYADNIIIKEFIMYPERRALEIKNSLEKYDIDNYVVLDDMSGLGEFFPNNFVGTNSMLTEEDVDKAIKILKK